MRNLKFLFISLVALTIFVFGAGKVEAHPGRTASDGCHYCRTNCDYWGVPWNQRHCHGGYTSPQTNTQPYNPPVLKVTPSPSPKPTPSPSPTPTPSPSPTPEVKGETTQTSPSPVAVQGEKKEGSDTLTGLLILAIVGGGAFWIGRSILRKFRPQPPNQNE